MNIEFNDKDIDVKEIMNKIHQALGKYPMKEDIDRVKVKTPTGIPHEMQSLFDEFLAQLTPVNRSWRVSAEYPITSHRKITGKFIVFTKKVIRKLLRWYIEPLAKSQTDFNAYVTRTLNAVWSIIQKQSSINEQINHKLKLIQLENTKLKFELEEYRKKLEEKQQLNSSELSDNIKRDLITEIENKLQEKKWHEENAQIKAQCKALETNIRVANERLRRIERTIRNQSSIVPTAQASETATPFSIQAEVKNKPLDFDYYLFEEYYRGTREEIKERQKQYLPYFSHAKKVLDLGCGRGEFTELLLEKGIEVISVDSNSDMVAYCKERGFNIIQADIIEFLKSLEDQSVDGIFLGQVIEHLSPEALIELVQLAHLKLTPNSWLIAETPNPRSLSIFAQSFYMDLTHTKPVHPYTAKFIWESEGFNDIEIKYFSPNNPVLKIPEIHISEMDPAQLQQLNTALSHWHEMLFGNQDYYIAGRK